VAREMTREEFAEFVRGLIGVARAVIGSGEDLMESPRLRGFFEEWRVPFEGVRFGLKYFAMPVRVGGEDIFATFIFYPCWEGSCETRVEYYRRGDPQFDTILRGGTFSPVIEVLSE